jgi:hypothetical protein
MYAEKQRRLDSGNMRQKMSGGEEIGREKGVKKK